MLANISRRVRMRIEMKKLPFVKRLEKRRIAMLYTGIANEIERKYANV